MDNLVLNIQQDKSALELIKAYQFQTLYRYIKDHEDEFEFINLRGSLQVPNAYQDVLDYFRVKFEDLDVYCTGETYIEFEDELTQKMCAEIFGDKVGLTESRAKFYTGAEVKRALTVDYDQITLFNEARYFTKMTQIPYQAFYAFRKLTSIDLPPSLIELKEQALYNCEQLSNFGHLENIQIFGHHALRGTKIQTIHCENVTTLQEQVFRECPELKSVYLDGPFTSIGQICFYQDKQLETVEGFTNVTAIPNQCFYQCESLKSVSFPNVTTINNNSAFRYCYALEKVDMPKLTSIGNESFANCTSLNEIDTSKVTNIGNNGFYYSSISNLDLSNVTTLGSSVFYGTTNLKDIDLPSLETSIGSLGNFIRSSKVEHVHFNEDAINWKTPYIIPANFADSATELKTINAGNCYQINAAAFWNCQNLETIGEQPETPILQSFGGDSAFYQCYKLESIDISLVSNIRAHTFEGCKKLKNLGNNNVLDKVEYLREYAFQKAGTEGEIGLGELSFPNCILIERSVFKDSYGITKLNFGKIQELKYEAFCRCKDVEYITGLENVTLCRNDVFWEATSLKEISLPNVEQFLDGGNQFYNCTGLQSVDLPKLKTLGGQNTFKMCRIDGLLNLPLLEDTQYQNTFESAKIKKINLHNCKRIFTYQFSGNSLLEEIDLTSCETFTNRQVFGDCTSIKHIELPSLKGTVYYFTFYNCNSLETITFGDNELTLNSEAVRYCPSLKSINLDHVIYIGDYCFVNDAKLESIGKFYNKLTYIGREAFESTALTGDITIPASVTTIGYRAFYNCGKITSITMEATTPPTMNNESFNGALSYPIYVPAGSVDAYKAATNWKNIASRIQAKP